MTPRRAVAACALAVVLGVVMLVLPASATASAPQAVGYWWRLRSGPAPQLAPPHVPAGGLWVAADPAGEQAISALRAEAPSGTTVARIELRVADAAGPVSVVACPATGAWEPAEAGPWEARPTSDCERFRIDGTTGEDGASITFDVAALRLPMIDIVLVPMPGSGAFSASFSPPDASTVATVPATQPANAPSPAPSVGPADASTQTTLVPAGADSTSGGPSAGGDSLYRAPLAGFAAPVYADAPSVRDAAAAPSATADVSTPRPATAVTAVSRGSRQPLALLAVAAGIAGWWWRVRAAVRGAAEHPLAQRRLGATDHAEAAA